MLCNYSINKVLGLPDIFLVQEKIINNNSYLYLSLPQKTHICPQCHKETSRIHDYREQIILDIPIRLEETTIIMKKRRYLCPHCGKKFYEDNTLVNRYKRQTNRCRLHILASLTDIKTINQIADEHYTSSGIVSRIMKELNYPKPATLPPVIAIDEFRGNVGEKFQCIVADPQHKTVLDILPTRKTEDLHAYFNQYSKKIRKKVRYIVMDLSPAFYSVLHSCFPKAKIIADKFHVVRLIVWAMENVRKEVQKKFHKNRRVSFKRSKYLLLKHQDLLTDEEKDQLAIMLQTSDKLRNAYRLKELFYDVMDSKTAFQFSVRYQWFKHEVEYLEMKEFQKHIQTLDKWYKAIKSGVIIGITNGFVEGCNNRTKVLKRICYGFRNFKIFRNRLLCIANNTTAKKKRRLQLAIS